MDWSGSVGVGCTGWQRVRLGWSGSVGVGCTGWQRVRLGWSGSEWVASGVGGLDGVGGDRTELERGHGWERAGRS